MVRGQWREFGQDTGVTPLFTRSVMRFLMTTESQDLGLTSHNDRPLSQIQKKQHNFSFRITKKSINMDFYTP